MKYILTFLLLISILYANNDLEIENDFLRSLEEVSEIATKTKLNIDETPSFVTVLQSQKLQQLGITNVFEALGLVPGVQLKRELSGVPVVSFRGIRQKGEVKLMIDGVTINNSYRGSIYYYLDFPIELIQRIEVIRGAGSVLYGSGAISGVVNIITKNSQDDKANTIFLSTGTYDDNLGGALLSTKLGDFKISLDSYYHMSNKMIQNPNNIAGKNDRHLKDYSLGIHINDEHFSLIGRVKNSDIGNAYGILGTLDQSREHANNKNYSYLAQLSYKNSFNKDNKITLLAGYNGYEQDAQSYISTSPIDAHYREKSYNAEINLISTSLKENEILVGLRFENAKTFTSEWISVAPVPPYISNPNFSRETLSAYINDKYSLTENLDISAGLRYDDYSDFGDSFSPNFGVVYRATESIRVKALYSHAYRAPSWVELTSNTNLKAEKSDSIETGIIYKKNMHNILRLNAYTIRVRDLITKPASTYIQNQKNHYNGVELEYIKIINNQIELNIFASYIKAVDDNGNKLPNVANTLASSSLTYEFNNGLSFGSLLKYVSSSQREDTDSREKISSSLIFDETISYVYQSVSASLIIKDLFDRGTEYELPIKSNTYSTDFDDGGRTFMLKISMEF